FYPRFPLRGSGVRVRGRQGHGIRAPGEPLKSYSRTPRRLRPTLSSRRMGPGAVPESSRAASAVHSCCDDSKGGYSAKVTLMLTQGSSHVDAGFTPTIRNGSGNSAKTAL